MTGTAQYSTTRHTLDMITAMITTALHDIQQPSRERTITLFFAVVWFLLAIALLLWQPLVMVLFVITSALVLWWLAQPIVPLYLIAAMYPFIHLEIIYGSFNVPVVDAIALIAVTAWVVRIAWTAAVRPADLRRFKHPVLVPMAIFLAIAVVSALNSFQPLNSLTYVIRPLAFFYIAYVLLPTNHLSSWTHIRRLFWIMVVGGTLVALYGVWGFFAMDAQTIWDRRVLALDLFGINPLGGNHNLIADVMITTIPLAWVLLRHVTTHVQKKALLLSLAIMAATTLLTFSRSGWIALAVEVVLITMLMHRRRLSVLIKPLIGVVIIALPLLLYMALFSTQDAVQSSNENRRILNDVAWQAFSDEPLLGIGPGNFMTLLRENRVFQEEFGAPIDAHGFLQKTLSETGLLGMIAFVAALVSVVAQLWTGYAKADTAHRHILAAVCVMVVADVIFQLFQTSYYVSKLWWPIGIALATVTVIRHTSKHHAL